MAPAHTPVSPPPKPAALPVLPQELLELCANLGRRLRDLETYQVPELAGCKGPLTLHEELASNVRGEMVGVRRDLEELKLQVDDLDKARDRKAGQDLVAGVQARITAITQLYRNAVLTSKRRIDNLSQASARDELFHSASKPNGKARSTTAPTPASADDALMAATSDVTEGLRRTMQLMQQELDRSLVSNEILESSTATMQMTSDQYSTFSTLLTTSKALITSLERADVLDRLILLFALIFFGLCCAWIFKRRVIDKGLRVAGAMGRVVAGGKGKDELKRSVQEVVETFTAVTIAATTIVQSMSKEVPTAAITAVVKGHEPVWVNTTVDLAAFSHVHEPVETPLAVPTNFDRQEVEPRSTGVVDELAEAPVSKDVLEEGVVADLDASEHVVLVSDIENVATDDTAASFDPLKLTQLAVVANASLSELSPTKDAPEVAIEEELMPLVDEEAEEVAAEAAPEEPEPEEEKIFVPHPLRPATPFVDAQAAIDSNLVALTTDDFLSTPNAAIFNADSLPILDSPTPDADEDLSPVNDTSDAAPSEPLDDHIFVPHVLRPAGTPFDEHLILENVVVPPAHTETEAQTSSEDLVVEAYEKQEYHEPVLLEALLEEAAEPVVRDEADVIVLDPSFGEGEPEAEEEEDMDGEEDKEVQEGEDDYDSAEEEEVPTDEGDVEENEVEEFEDPEPGWELLEGEYDSEKEEEDDEGNQGFSGEVIDALEREGAGDAEQELGAGHLRDEL